MLRHVINWVKGIHTCVSCTLNGVFWDLFALYWMVRNNSFLVNASSVVFALETFVKPFVAQQYYIQLERGMLKKCEAFHKKAVGPIVGLIPPRWVFQNKYGSYSIIPYCIVIVLAGNWRFKPKNVWLQVYSWIEGDCSKISEHLLWANTTYF